MALENVISHARSLARVVTPAQSYNFFAKIIFCQKESRQNTSIREGSPFKNLISFWAMTFHCDSLAL